MSVFSENLSCPHCGRSVFAVFRCPDRKQGMCPFMKRWSGASWHLALGCPFALVFIAFFLAGIGHNEWIFVVVLTAGLLVWLLPRDIQFYDQRSGILVQITTLMGVELRRRVMKKCEPLFLPLKPVRALHYPLSVVTLGDRPRALAEDDHRAACVFRAALVDLLLKGLIQIQPVAHYDRGVGQSAHVTKNELSIVALPSALSHERVTGLEQDILRIIANRTWDNSGKDVWLGGPRVYDLARAYFSEDVPNPQGSVLDGVEQEAAALDLCQIEWKGFWQKSQKAIWGGACLDVLRTDGQTADDLVQQFKSFDTATWDGLFAQISEGLKSRIETSAD